jgi:hypothetical protein
MMVVGVIRWGDAVRPLCLRGSAQVAKMAAGVGEDARHDRHLALDGPALRIAL